MRCARCRTCVCVLEATADRPSPAQHAATCAVVTLAVCVTCSTAAQQPPPVLPQHARDRPISCACVCPPCSHHTPPPASARGTRSSGVAGWSYSRIAAARARGAPTAHVWRCHAGQSTLSGPPLRARFFPVWRAACAADCPAGLQATVTLNQARWGRQQLDFSLALSLLRGWSNMATVPVVWAIGRASWSFEHASFVASSPLGWGLYTLEEISIGVVRRGAREALERTPTAHPAVSRTPLPPLPAAPCSSIDNNRR